MQWETGDVVRLRTSRQDMTVRVYDTCSSWVYCVWFVGKKLKQAPFHPEALISRTALGPLNDPATRTN